MQNMTCQGVAKTSDIMHIETRTDDPKILPEHQRKTSKRNYYTEDKDMNEARAIFPDFFPRLTTQDSCEDSSWRTKLTMEQLFSEQTNASSEKCDPLENWRKHQLSF